MTSADGWVPVRALSPRAFFTFEFESAGRDLAMRIGVPREQTGVLDAIAALR